MKKWIVICKLVLFLLQTVIVMKDGFWNNHCFFLSKLLIFNGNSEYVYLPEKRFQVSC